MSTTTHWALRCMGVVALVITCIATIMPCAAARGPREWITTCGIGNPADFYFGHGGIDVNGKDRVVDGVKVCTWELINDLISWFIEIEVENVTDSGLSCDSSTQLFVGEADDASTMERLCGPSMNFSKIYPGNVIIQIKGDTGGDITDIRMDVALVVVDYMEPCNRSYHQEDRRIDIDKTIHPDQFLYLPYHCYWMFNTPGTLNRLIVDLYSVNLEGPDYDSVGCRDNGLTIIDGWERDQTKVIETCNKNSTGFTFTSSYNSLYVFVTIADPGQQTMAFNFSVTPFSLTQCYGQVISLKATSQSNYITSPGYPDTYYEHLNCLWRIESDDGNEIEILFGDMDLAFYDCEYDHVLVYDGRDQSSFLLANECFERNNEKHRYRSSDKAFLVQFRSNDMNVEGRGFKLSYYTREQPSPDLVPDTTCRDNVVRLKATSGDQFLSSVGYPNHYPPNSDCRWLLYSDNDDEIEVEIVELELESSRQCQRADALDIYGGQDTDVSPLASVCSNLEGNKAGTKFRSAGRSMLIHFTSDSSAQLQGFKLRYYTKADPSPDLANVTDCRGKMVYLNTTEEKQNLSSYGYPHSYHPLSDCRWQIRSDLGNTTKMDIVNLDLDHGNDNVNCDLDFLEVFDGPSVNSRSLGRFCDGSHSVEGSGQFLTIQFKSDYEDSHGRGFELHYYIDSKDTTTKGPDTGHANRASFLVTFSLAVLIGCWAIGIHN